MGQTKNNLIAKEDAQKNQNQDDEEYIFNHYLQGMKMIENEMRKILKENSPEETGELSKSRN